MKLFSIIFLHGDYLKIVLGKNSPLSPLVAKHLISLKIIKYSRRLELKETNTFCLWVGLFRTKDCITSSRPSKMLRPRKNLFWSEGLQILQIMKRICVRLRIAE